MTELRPATPEDAPVCVMIMTAWIEETRWMPRLHSDASMIAYWGGRLAMAEGWVVVEAQEVVGFCVRDEGFVTALYVHADARRRGVGKVLLDRAKKDRDQLDLWLFVPNGEARAFYIREGFTEIRRTEEDNEEGLPDILMRWRRD